jgi:RimJ/RimL family protein N-acetyltransferase
MTTRNIPMPIITPRLRLRPLQPGDGAMVLQYKKDSWAEIKNWGVWSHPPFIETRTVEDDEAFCAYKFEKFKKGEDITLVALDKETGDMIGAGGLHQCAWDIPMFTLGFQVHSKKTGKGYGTEIATALTKYAFEALGAKKVATRHAEGNIGSQRVIEKTGFIKEGVLRKCHNLYARGIVDEHHFGLLKGEFQSDMNVSWG